VLESVYDRKSVNTKILENVYDEEYAVLFNRDPARSGDAAVMSPQDGRVEATVEKCPKKKEGGHQVCASQPTVFARDKPVSFPGASRRSGRSPVRDRDDLGEGHINEISSPWN
jgi:hypothetical protein